MREREKADAQRPLENLSELVGRVARDEAEQVIFEKQVAKRNAMLNIKARIDIEDFVGAFDDPSQGLMSLLVGTIRSNRNARRSIDARGKALEAELVGGLISNLRKGEYLRLARSGEIDDDIAREMWELRHGGEPGVTGNIAAKEIADILARWKEVARGRVNAAGGMIGRFDGHIAQTHDGSKVRKAGREAWIAEILPRLDEERTFQGADPQEFLSRVFDDIAVGQSFGGTVADGRFFDLTKLDALISKPRVLHFRSAEDWMAYRQRFGAGNLTEGVLHGLRSLAQDAALMERLGPNPKLTFETVRNRLMEASRDDIAVFERLNGRQLDHQFAAVSGEMNVSGNITMAKVGQGIRTFQSLVKLGSAALSSVTNLVDVAANTRYRGDNLLEGYSEAIRSIFRGRGDGEIRDIADDLGVGFEGTIRAVMSRFYAEDGQPGAMSKALNDFSRINGTVWWTDAQKTGFALMSSHSLAKRSGDEFEALPGRLQAVLRQHGIGAEEWSVIRLGVQEAGDGRKYLTPDGVMRLPDSVATSGQRRHMADLLRAYFVEEADFAIPTPGARERALMLQGTRPGTVSGEFWRPLMQSKAGPISQALRTLGRAVDGQPGHASQWDVPGIVHVMIGTTVLGYLAMAMEDMAGGRTPRDPSKPHTWAMAFLQSGGAGIYADFLFGEHSRFGGLPLRPIAGPTFGMIDDAVDLWATVREGGDVAANAFNLAISNTPYTNLWYSRAALDYLLIYQIQETLNPGYLRRMERRMEKDNAQTFVFPPSRSIPRGGAGLNLTLAR